MSSHDQSSPPQEIGLPWYRMIATKRWLSYVLLTVIFASACVGLGIWQFNRREEARQEIDKVLANYNADPVELSSLVPTLSAFNDATKWRTVTITGTYLADQQYLVRSRPREQQAGYEVLTPLRLSNGNVFIVDRGWLPAGNSADQAPSIPAPPTGIVTVTARLKSSEPAIPGRTYNNGQLATIELPLVAKLLNSPAYTGSYGLLASEQPPAAAAPLPAIAPTLNEGNHLSYALQWLAFAILGMSGLAWAIRNEWKIRNADRPDQQAKRRAAQEKKSRRKSAEQLEDELLDSAF